MSKDLFISIVSSRDSQLTPAQLEGYWERGLSGLLPARILEFIKLDLYRIPKIYHAYLTIKGHSPVFINKDSFKRLVLETLIDGPRYMSELQQFFSVPAKLRREVMEELITERAVKYEFCPVGNAILYSLNCQKRLPKKSERQIAAVLGETEVTLYHLSLQIGDVDYVYLCAWFRDLLFRGSKQYVISYNNEKRALVRKSANNLVNAL